MVSRCVLGREGATAYSFFLGSHRRIPFHRSERGDPSSAALAGCSAAGVGSGEAGDSVAGFESLLGGGGGADADAAEPVAVFFDGDVPDRGGAFLKGSLSIVAHHLPPSDTAHRVSSSPLKSRPSPSQTHRISLLLVEVPPGFRTRVTQQNAAVAMKEAFRVAEALQKHQRKPMIQESRSRRRIVAECAFEWA